MNKNFNLESSNIKTNNILNQNSVSIITEFGAKKEENNNSMNYVSDLLYKNNCVIIPGLGGFIADYSPAKINRVNNSITPPSKSIVFNERLHSNDGLLAHHISALRNISFIEANQIIEQFVSLCENKLRNNQKIRFPEVGIIWRNIEGRLEFEPDTSANYLEATFGMQQITAPPIVRSTREERFEKQFQYKRSKPVGNKSEFNIVKTLKWAAVIIPLAAFSLWGIVNADLIKSNYNEYSHYFTPQNNSEQIDYSAEDQIKLYNQRIAELNGINSNKAGIFTPELVGIKSTKVNSEIEEDLPIEDSTDNYQNDQEYDDVMNMYNNKSYVESDSENDTDYTEDEIDYSEPETKVVENIIEFKQPIQNSYNKYHIIVGAYGTSSNAQKFVNRLNVMGYVATITGQSNSGLYRVSALSSSSENEALNMLKIIREEDYPSAWLLKL